MSRSVSSSVTISTTFGGGAAVGGRAAREQRGEKEGRHAPYATRLAAGAIVVAEDRDDAPAEQRDPLEGDLQAAADQLAGEHGDVGDRVQVQLRDRAGEHRRVGVGDVDLVAAGRDRAPEAP